MRKVIERTACQQPEFLRLNWRAMRILLLPDNSVSCATLHSINRLALNSINPTLQAIAGKSCRGIYFTTVRTPRNDDDCTNRLI